VYDFQNKRTTMCGDSGLSDSQFQKAQKRWQEKSNQFVEDYNKVVERMHRFKKKEKEKTLWEKVRTLFGR